MVEQSETEDGLDRLRRWLSFDPLVVGWASQPAGELTATDEDALAVIAAADRDKVPITVTHPGGRWALPLLAAVDLAARPLLESARKGDAPVAYVTDDILRRSELGALSVAGVNVAEGLSPVILRGDGLVRSLSGRRVDVLGWRNRLVLVPPRVGFPEVAGDVRPRTVIVEARSDGAPTEEAARWAAAARATLVIFVPLGADVNQLVGHCWPLDWPYLAARGVPLRSLAAGVTAVEVPDPRLGFLAEARSLLGEISRRHPDDSWPKALRNASALGRQLASAMTPLDIYDLSTAGSIAVSFAARRSSLEEVRSRDLPPPFHDVADIEWGRLRHCLLEAADLLEEDNRKALALGVSVEEAVAAGQPLDVLCDSEVAATAVLSWLAGNNWAIPGRAFSDLVQIRTLSNRASWADGERPALIGGIPARRHRSRLLAGDTGPLSVLSYEWELARLRTVTDQLLNADTAANVTRRSDVVEILAKQPTGLVGAEPVGMAVALKVAPGPGDEPELPGTDSWSRRDDTRLDAFWPSEEEDERKPESNGDETVGVIALLVEPGPAVVLLEADQIVDRLAGGRLWPMVAGDLREGMIVVGLVAGEHRSLFERLRPYLERVRTPGEAAWLHLWRDALRAAIAECGSWERLAAELHRLGARLSTAAVRGWTSPHRIGPRRTENVARVGVIAGRPVVEVHAGDIAAVMRSVRALHNRIGRHLAAALRAEIAGNHQALEDLDGMFGSDLLDAAGDLSVWTVYSVLASGAAPRRFTRQPLSAAQAHNVFCPNTDVPTELVGVEGTRERAH